jgi:transposase
MDRVECKKCKSQNYIKSGIIRGHQRYKCKECNCQFTATQARGVDPALKNIATILYGYCGVSMLKISKLLGVSAVSVLKWMRSEGKKIEQPNPKSDSGIVIIDEMWHYVDQKKQKFGSGEPLMAKRVEFLGGYLVIAVMPH